MVIILDVYYLNWSTHCLGCLSEIISKYQQYQLNSWDVYNISKYQHYKPYKNWDVFSINWLVGFFNMI